MHQDTVAIISKKYKALSSAVENAKANIIEFYKHNIPSQNMCNLQVDSLSLVKSLLDCSNSVAKADLAVKGFKQYSNGNRLLNYLSQWEKFSHNWKNNSQIQRVSFVDFLLQFVSLHPSAFSNRDKSFRLYHIKKVLLFCKQLAPDYFNFIREKNLVEEIDHHVIRRSVVFDLHSIAHSYSWEKVMQAYDENAEIKVQLDKLIVYMMKNLKEIRLNLIGVLSTEIGQHLSGITQLPVADNGDGNKHVPRMPGEKGTPQKRLKPLSFGADQFSSICCIIRESVKGEKHSMDFMGKIPLNQLIDLYQSADLKLLKSTLKTFNADKNESRDLAEQLNKSRDLVEQLSANIKPLSSPLGPIEKYKQEQELHKKYALKLQEDARNEYLEIRTKMDKIKMQAGFCEVQPQPECEDKENKELKHRQTAGFYVESFTRLAKNTGQKFNDACLRIQEIENQLKPSNDTDNLESLKKQLKIETVHVDELKKMHEKFQELACSAAEFAKNTPESYVRSDLYKTFNGLVAQLVIAISQKHNGVSSGIRAIKKQLESSNDKDELESLQKECLKKEKSACELKKMYEKFQELARFVVQLAEQADFAHQKDQLHEKFKDLSEAHQKRISVLDDILDLLKVEDVGLERLEQKFMESNGVRGLFRRELFKTKTSPGSGENTIGAQPQSKKRKLG